MKNTAWQGGASNTLRVSLHTTRVKPVKSITGKVKLEKVHKAITDLPRAPACSALASTLWM
jgi:hypothetical protein